MSKKAIAQRVFSEMINQQRKMVIAAISEQAGLSQAGATTYYNNFKNDKWTNSEKKVKAAAATPVVIDTPLVKKNAIEAMAAVLMR